MTVAQLIALLQECESNLPVRVNNRRSDPSELEDLTQDDPDEQNRCVMLWPE